MKNALLLVQYVDKDGSACLYLRNYYDNFSQNESQVHWCRNNQEYGRNPEIRHNPRVYCIANSNMMCEFAKPAMRLRIPHYL